MEFFRQFSRSGIWTELKLQMKDTHVNQSFKKCVLGIEEAKINKT